MKTPIPICLLVSGLLLGSAQAKPFQEKIVQLHAPIAGMSPDGTQAYGNMFLVTIMGTTHQVETVEIYNSITDKIKLVGARPEDSEASNRNKWSYSQDDLKRSLDNNIDNQGSFFDLRFTNLFSVGKQSFGSIFLNRESLIKNNSEVFWKITSDEKYIYDGDDSVILIANLKTQKTINKIYLDSDNHERTPSSIVINDKKNRLLIAGTSDIGLYKIDFSHLPKTRKELEKQKIMSLHDNGNVSPRAATAEPSTLVISPDGKTAAAIISQYADRRYGTIWVRDMMTGKVKYMLKEDMATNIAFSYDGKYLALECYVRDSRDPQFLLETKDISVLSAKTGKLIRKYSGSNSLPLFTKNGKLLYSDAKNRLHIITLP